MEDQDREPGLKIIWNEMENQNITYIQQHGVLLHIEFSDGRKGIYHSRTGILVTS